MKFKEIKKLWKIWLAKFVNFDPENKEQLIDLLRKSEKNQIINHEILSVMEGAIAFEKLQVRDIMLPKKQMTCISKDSLFNEVITIVTHTGHSRFPVTGENKDEVIGILHVKDLLRFQLKQEYNELDLSDIARQAPIVPESKPLDALLNEFKTNRNHMAIVVDEYGSVSGFVTIEDIIEQIIGDIADEFDVDEEAYIKSHGDKNYIIKAHMPIEDFNEQLQTNFSNDVYDTIGGIITASFGYVPKTSETIFIDDFEFIIINADARSIHLLECFDRRPKTTVKSD
ncbi:MAG: CBS domain-containing protein [Legionellaceae bacterium]|nr:CBS domain-containing protein [Legionellaceae bacterium]